ncbi:MAG: dihydrofolate reductase family protein [Chloroflexota bacterium]
MRSVILQIDVTLDGFIGALDGDTSWITSDEAMNQDGLDLLTTADTIILGRVAYQMFSSYWPFADGTAPTTLGKITAQINHATKLVVSNTLQNVEWGSWNNARVISGDLAEEIAALKAQPGKNMLLYAGARIISTFIELGLVDEYRLRIHPVALGSGMPIFARLQDRLKLKLVQTKLYPNGAVLLDYRPDAK